MANLFDQANERKKWDATIAQVGQMGYPQNPAQPPAFHIAPAAPPDQLWRRGCSYQQSRCDAATELANARQRMAHQGGDRRRGR